MKMTTNQGNVWLVLALVAGCMVWGQQPTAKCAFVQAVVSLQPACQDAVIDAAGRTTCQDSRAAVDKICGQARRYLEDWLEDEDWELGGSATVPGITILNLELSGVTRQIQEIVSTAGRSYVTYFAMLVRVRLTQNGVTRCLDYTPRESFTSVAADVAMTESIRMALMKQGIDKLMKTLQGESLPVVPSVGGQPAPGSTTVAPPGRTAVPYTGMVVQPSVRVVPAVGYSVQPNVRMVPGGQVVVPRSGIVVPSARVIYPRGNIR